MNYGQSYDSEELAELFSVNSNPTSPASFRPMDTGMCPPATTYVISYAHTLENQQILQQFHTVTI